MNISTILGSGIPGEELEILGDNFGNTQGLKSVRINGVTQTVSSWSNDRIVITADITGSMYNTSYQLEIRGTLFQLASFPFSFSTPEDKIAIIPEDPVIGDEDTFSIFDPIITPVEDIGQVVCDITTDLGNPIVYDPCGTVIIVGAAPGEMHHVDCIVYNEDTGSWEDPVTPEIPTEETTATEVPAVLGKANTKAFKQVASLGHTKGHYNFRAIQYWRSLGATARQYNLAKKQAELAV